MAKCIPDAAKQLTKIVSEITGIRSAPDSPPERASAFPFLICYIRSGSFQPDNAYTATDTAILGLHTFACALHVARRDLPRAYELSLPYAELIKNALFKQANLNWNGTIETYTDPITFEFGNMEYGGVETLGYLFAIPVKIQNDTTVS